MPDGKPTRPLILPIFLPHQGCPHRCIFCQQETITAQTSRPIHKATVTHILDTALATAMVHGRREREIAFYGGTFTGLPLEKMKELLEGARPYLERGHFHSIRVSTRPDELDEERAELMKGYGVSTVELGVQSMDDRVLEMAQRGHTVQDTMKAVHLLKGYGFRLVVQLMPGLPGDTEEGFLKTVDHVIGLRPQMVRLYPAVVIRGTVLARWYKEGRYRPLELEEAVRICRESCIRLEKKGIPVISFGLISNPILSREGQIIAGPWHEAFGFLVRWKIHQEKIESFFPKRG
ncbi:MAG: radical SAM protein, partial [Pseudomonadota bacterium]